MREVKEILDEAQEKMDMAVMYLEEALAHIRAGKADVRLLDGIRVDSYGSMVPINNVAAVNTPDARSIVIKPWDKSMFKVRFQSRKRNVYIRSLDRKRKAVAEKGIRILRLDLHTRITGKELVIITGIHGQFANANGYRYFFSLSLYF